MPSVLIALGTILKTGLNYSWIGEENSGRDHNAFCRWIYRPQRRMQSLRSNKKRLQLGQLRAD